MKWNSHPVRQNEDGSWMFWDETWSQEHGPFETKKEAQENLAKYLDYLKRGPKETTITTTCPWCSQQSSFEVDAKGHQEWKAGKLIQEAFPSMDASKRESLISGICHNCWEETFGN